MRIVSHRRPAADQSTRHISGPVHAHASLVSTAKANGVDQCLRTYIIRSYTGNYAFGFDAKSNDTVEPIFGEDSIFTTVSQGVQK